MSAREVLWQPQDGPQHTFCGAGEFEVLYGGAAFGGKTDALLMVPLDQMHHPAAKVLFLRFTFPELRECMDRALALFPRLGGRWNATEKRWTFPSGATYQFGYCETYQDALQYQGQEFSFLCFDEIGKLAEERTWVFLLSRVRSKAADLRVYARCTANPGGAGHGWLKRRFILPTERGTTIVQDATTGSSRRFIPARAQDNPIGMRNDPGYVKRLQLLPELMRRQLLEGDWEAGEGLALEELERSVHLVEPFVPPPHWRRFGGLDWGFAHPWAFPFGAMSPDGAFYVEDTAWGRKQQIDVIGDRMIERLAARTIELIAGGHDLWHERKAHREEWGPTLAEALMARQLPLTKATVSRVTGLNNLRHWTAHRGRDAAIFPRLKFMRTEGNLRLFDQLEVMVTDPDSPEEPLKVDADPETGEGGDDGFDALRYLMMLRPYSEQPKARELEPGNTSNDRDWLPSPERQVAQHVNPEGFTMGNSSFPAGF